MHTLPQDVTQERDSLLENPIINTILRRKSIRKTWRYAGCQRSMDWEGKLEQA